MNPKLIESKGEIDNLTIIIGDFSTTFFIISWIIRKKYYKEIKDLKNTTHQPDLADSFRILHLTTEE